MLQHKGSNSKSFAILRLYSGPHMFKRNLIQWNINLISNIGEKLHDFFIIVKFIPFGKFENIQTSMRVTWPPKQSISSPLNCFHVTIGDSIRHITYQRTFFHKLKFLKYLGSIFKHLGKARCLGNVHRHVCRFVKTCYLMLRFRSRSKYSGAPELRA